MRSLPDPEHQKIDRMLTDVLEDLIVRSADSHIGFRVAEFSGRMRDDRVKSTEEATLKAG
jgi:hypothetical protein